MVCLSLPGHRPQLVRAGSSQSGAWRGVARRGGAPRRSRPRTRRTSVRIYIARQTTSRPLGSLRAATPSAQLWRA